MSRARLAYALAFLGILITTGGCAESATAPEAATLRGAASPATNVLTNPTDADQNANPRARGGTTEDEVASLMGGVILNGGGRAEEP